MTQGDQHIVLNKVGDEWKMISPQLEPADSAEVSDLISTVTNLRADEFVEAGSPEVARAQFDKPRVDRLAQLQPPDDPAHDRPRRWHDCRPDHGPCRHPGGITVTIGEPTSVEMDKAYVRVSDTGVVAKASLAETSYQKLANASPLSLRDKRVLDINPEKASEFALEIDRPATTQPTTRPAEHRTVRVERTARPS